MAGARPSPCVAGGRLALCGLLLWLPLPGAAAAQDAPEAPQRPEGPTVNWTSDGLYRVDFSHAESVLEYLEDAPHFQFYGGRPPRSRITSGSCVRQELERGASLASIGFVAMVFHTISGQRLTICASDAPLEPEAARGICLQVGMSTFAVDGARVTCIKPSA